MSILIIKNYMDKYTYNIIILLIKKNYELIFFNLRKGYL